MHDIEPYYSWNHLYRAEEDERTPFYERTYSEFYFTHAVYNYVIHPQWDAFGSPTLYLKLLFADYQKGFCILEFMGEWNDAIHNDIMTLKRELIEVLIAEGIDKFILIGEHVLNFHGSDDAYYEEWFQDVEEGWIACINFLPHVLTEFKTERLDYYLIFGGELDDLDWRTFSPDKLFSHIATIISHRIA
jgi:hypothetical protein